jgi:chromosome segregation protein
LRLVHIKLSGFKSFVDPTIIPASQDLVGIVGPNGCGKSNIIDAIRWVLGESKASALRGESMQDVIFSGSDHRKAVSRASAEIVFDNHASTITGQWSSYSEIAIKRTLQRNGTSTYYINNLQVRRRDISDLFLGTGVGGRGYAIIEQGMISRVIEAKPQELRDFLEEAAGISQYRERKQETSLRLAETKKNLIRLEDIYQELEAQSQQLEMQADIARTYQSLQEELRIAQALLWLQRKSDAMHQRLNAEKEIKKLEIELNIMLSNQHEAEKEYEITRKKEYVINDKLLQTQGQLYTVNAEIGRLEQEINHLQNNSERLELQIGEIENQLEKSNRSQKITSENLNQCYQEKIKAELSYTENILKKDEANKELPDIEENFLRCQEDVDKCQHNLVLIEQANQLENSSLAHTTKNIQQLEVRHSRLLKEQNELIPGDPFKLNALQSEMDEATNLSKEQNLNHENLKNQHLSAIQHQQLIANKIQQLQHALSQVTARFQALKNLQQKLENNHNLTAWLSKHRLDVLPRLWQKIQIHPTWENALEAVLRERLNAIEVAQLTVIHNWLDDSPSGKWTVFEKIQLVASFHETSISRHENFKKLLDHVTIRQSEIQSLLEDWLSHVYVVEDTQQGIAKRTALNSHEMFVTPQGHMITRASFTFYTPDSQLHGVLSRQQELENIQLEIDRLEPLLRSEHERSKTAEQHVALLDDKMQKLHASSQQTRQRQHELQLEIVRLAQINERTEHRNRQINAELIEIKQLLDNEISLKQNAQVKLIENSEQIDRLKQLTQQVQLAWKTADRLRTDQQQILHHLAKQSQEAAYHVKTCDHKINELKNTLKSIDQDAQQLTEKHHNLCEEKDSLDATPLHKQLEIAQQQRQSIEQISRQIRQEVEDTANLLREIENTRIASEQKSYSLRDSIGQARLKEQAAHLTVNQFDELITEAKIDPGTLSPLLDKKNITTLQSEINRLNTDITALGSVNLAALEELNIAHTRRSTLLVQLQDLNVAIATLENVILQIDQETQLRLQETFDLVNKYLNEIFPVMFAGGEAKLELSDGKILDAGLYLMAHPPGKKNSSIHLLSGGEKALTALALIFSLFRLNPAPFCLLDEVDAPLDDSNTSRFCNLVKNMSKQTQFLFISHNKITMEMAQQLIGVTMQEQGVSRIVAVDIANAVKMGKRIKQTTP